MHYCLHDGTYELYDANRDELWGVAILVPVGCGGCGTDKVVISPANPHPGDNGLAVEDSTELRNPVTNNAITQVLFHS
jgi:hypothetical protein